MQESLKKFTDMLSEFNRDTEFLPSAKDAVESTLEGDFQFSVKDFIVGIIRVIFSVMEENVMIIMTLVAIAFVCSICMTAADCDQPLWNDSLLVAMGLALAVPAANTFYICIDSAYDFFTDMEVINLSVIPALATVAVPVKTGVFITVAQLLIQIMKNVFLPAAIVYGVLRLCSVTGDRFSLSKISEMIKSIFNWGLGFVMLIFSVITTGAGFVSGISLSLTVKTIQYTAGTAVPVVGQYLSQSADVVSAGASLVKGAAGIGAVIALATVCIIPFLEMFGLMIIMRIASVIIRPVLDIRLASVVDGVGDSVSMMMASVALMSVFSFLNIAVIAGAGIGAL